MSWSSGKDSAYTLYTLQQLQAEYCVIGLVTTLTKTFDRVSMHGVRIELLKEQAKQIGLPLHIVAIPFPCSETSYDSLWHEFLTKRKIIDNISHVAFGDLFLEDVRCYRETRLATVSIGALFPLWHKNTKTLSEQIIASGFKAIVTCIDPKKLDKSFAGREYNKDFLADLPPEVDPCGENGEFHTFVYAAPLFHRSINVSVGDIVERDGYLFADLLLNNKQV